MSTITLWISLSFVLLVKGQNVSDLEYPCNSPIFCYGPVLHAAQMLEIHHDSKTFVDRPIKNATVDQVLQAFDSLSLAMRGNVTKEAMIQFVNTWFLPVGSSTEEYLPPDWLPVDQGGLPLYHNITNPRLKEFAKNIHERWYKLGRKIKEPIRRLTGRLSDYDKTESIIHIPHPFIVPGGRFQEMYYWDSFWTIQGLLASGMKDTVANMLRNFAYLINRLGHMPNANRVYYEKRSQPPFFALMIDAYRQHNSVYTNESLALITELMPALEIEQHFFQTQRSVTVEKNGHRHHLNVFRGGMTEPRPEAYNEDRQLADALDGSQTDKELFANLAAGAESGWDFSSRWYDDARANFSTIRTESIIPVDLNAILCRSEQLMADFYTVLGNSSQAQVFQDKARKRADAIHELMWNDAKKMWRDYDTKYSRQRETFYTSHITPLFAKCVGKVNITSTAFLQDVLNSDDIKQITAFAGGFPQSLVQSPVSGQQWDFPYAWPPNQLMMIESFMGDAATRETARKWAQLWMDVVYTGFVKSGSFYEKYDARVLGMYGGGGEYEVQEGFGWTNGGILRLMEIFPNQLVANPLSNNNSASSNNKFASFLFCITCLLFIRKLL